MTQKIVILLQLLFIAPAMFSLGTFVVFAFGTVLAYIPYRQQVARRAWPLLLLPAVYALVWATGFAFEYPAGGPASRTGETLVWALLGMTVALGFVTIWLMESAWPFAVFYALLMACYIWGAAIIVFMGISGDGF